MIAVSIGFSNPNNTIASKASTITNPCMLFDAFTGPPNSFPINPDLFWAVATIS